MSPWALRTKKSEIFERMENRGNTTYTIHIWNLEPFHFIPLIDNGRSKWTPQVLPFSVSVTLSLLTPLSHPPNLSFQSNFTDSQIHPTRGRRRFSRFTPRMCSSCSSNLRTFFNFHSHSLLSFQNQFIHFLFIFILNRTQWNKLFPNSLISLLYKIQISVIQFNFIPFSLRYSVYVFSILNFDCFRCLHRAFGKGT